LSQNIQLFNPFTRVPSVYAPVKYSKDKMRLHTIKTQIPSMPR